LTFSLYHPSVDGIGLLILSLIIPGFSSCLSMSSYLLRLTYCIKDV
jgi:hypothetical protein